VQRGLNPLEPQEDKLFDNRKAGSRADRRPKLPWPEGQTYKILSLDGGGIKGIFTACMLGKIASEYARDEPLTQYFEHIAGTSTGGIIALGLGLEIPSQKIVELYTKDGAKIFPPWRFKLKKWTGRLGQLLWNKSVFDRKYLDIILKQTFGDRKYRECKPRMTIPAFKLPSAELAVLKTDHHPDYKHDPRNTCRKIAAATSAAPTFLKGVENGSTVFFDGGVWANNPIMLAVNEAITAYDIGLDQISVLSIGTGSPAWSTKNPRLNKGALGWADIFEGMMYLNGEAALSQARLMLGPENVVRVEPEGAQAAIDMADWQTARQELPSEAARLFEQNKDLFARFFESKAHPRDHFLTD